jgi:hypothetical protein
MIELVNGTEKTSMEVGAPSLSSEQSHPAQARIAFNEF